ncbi:type III secretion system translocon subunit SctE [Yersinia mollaretii]|uniref:type III secretion system translocon subunit SctE n=1 Tax=Yersinia mollaretii TaxID=33060 RepID=UPI0011AAD3A7|nr:type III secretion system translocon subunit SctE [Yersinia mollaretii]
MRGSIQIDGVPSANTELNDILPKIAVQTASISSGALGSRLSATYVFDEEHHGLKGEQYVSQQQAENALQQLIGIGSTDAGKPTIRDVLEMDPMVLSMMMTQLVLNNSGNTASSICKQLERATDLQAELRNKQVEEYQEQINKAIEQADQARKVGIMSAVFDWIIGGVEAVIGLLKIVEGFATANPLTIADGTAYFSAGIAGMVKAGTETAMALGADKETCNEIIKVTGIVQNACEGVALALDVIQIGRGIGAARAVTQAVGDVLEKEIGTQLIEAVAKGAEEELKVIADKVGQEVGRVLGEDFGMVVEREMVEVCDMAIEVAAHSAEAEANVVARMGKSFTRAGVETLVKTAVEKAGKELLYKGKEIVAEKLRDAILQKLRRSIISTIIRDCSSKALLATRACVGGANKISISVVANRTAELQRTIEKLIVQQGFIDFMQSWAEERKKTQQKWLNEAYQDGANAMRSASDMIDNCGTVLENIAGARA